MPTTHDIASLLLDIQAVKVSVDPPFIWNTGLATPIYTDNRLIASYPDKRAAVVDGFVELIKEHKLEFDVIAGTATAGIPWAAFLAWKLDKPMVYVRSHPKDYGLAKKVEGHIPDGGRVLVAEDLISTGRSSIATITACREECNAQIVAVLNIFNYEMQKSKDAFATAGTPLYSLCGFSALIDVAEQNGYLSKEEKQSALEWSSNPESWSKAHGGV